MKCRMLVACVLIGVFTLAAAGCGGGGKQGPAVDPTLSEAPCPVWYTQIPTDPNFMFAAATETSRDLQMAVDAAKTTCQADLAGQMETQIQQLRTQFKEEIGLPDESKFLRKFSSACKAVVDQTIRGARVEETSQKKEGNYWRACVLMKLPVGASEGAILKTITNDEEMYTRFRESQAFQQLEKAVQDKRDLESGRH